VGTLRLELLPQGSGFVRHPSVLLMPCDSEFLEGLEIAAEYVRTLPLTGSVRWNLAIGNFPRNRSDARQYPPHEQWLPQMVQGGSLGGAFGVGAHLLCDPDPESDLSIAITAKLLSPRGGRGKEEGAKAETRSAASNQSHEEESRLGALGPIAGAEAKFRACASDTLWPIHRIIFPAGQEKIPNSSALQNIRVGTVKKALDQFLIDIKPRRVMLESVKADCGQIVLANRDRVPMDSLYQDVPLLQEVPEQELLERDQPPPGSPAEPGVGRRPVSRPHYQEPGARFHSSPQASRLPDVLGRSPQIVVLGDPASGKTTMEQFVAFKVATDRDWISWRAGHLVPAFVSLKVWAAAPGAPSLPAYLKSRYTGCKGGPNERHWKKWLKDGNVLLLFDGLDEVSNETFLESHVRKALHDYSDCPAILTCRTVSRGRLLRVGIDKARKCIYTPRPLGTDEQKAYITAYPFVHRRNREALFDDLQQRSEFQDMAGTPGLLSIICFLMDAPGEPKLPGTRTELYDLVVDKLLALPADEGKEVPDLPAAPRKPYLKRLILEELCFRLSDVPERPTDFSTEQIMETLQTILTQGGYTDGAWEQTAWVLQDLQLNSRLLAGEPLGTTSRHDYYFSHITFQEFLAASAIARTIERSGWQSDMEDRLDRFSWMPQWEQIIIFLAGMLKLRHDRAKARSDRSRLRSGLLSLLNLLSDASRDDFFRHRLALAVLALAETVDPTKDRTA
jgi:hypothetical protein